MSNALSPADVLRVNVNFTSLFFVPDFSFLSLILASSLSLLVALCSASFLFSKSFGLTWVFVENFVLLGLNGLPFLANLLCDFSIKTEFFPCDFCVSKLLKDFFGFPDIVNFNFLFSIRHLSIFINYISRRHY